jgi:hypothetical protein
MSETAEQTTPTFVDPSGRSRAFKLKYPVIVGGRTYSEIYLARLTVGEVAQFLDAVSNGDKRSAIAWPVYRDESGEALPQAVLNALDDDDGFTDRTGVAGFFAPSAPGASRRRYGPASWRTYRAFVARVIGWRMAELNAMEWRDFLAEVDEARRVEGLDD